MSYELYKEVMTDDKKRAGFNTLATQTFGLSFENWYQNGYWNHSNLPYTLFDGEKAISNITVNFMKFFYQGKVRNYIQLGGVMTDPAYRGMGLSRQLMEKVQKDWKDKCDAMFLMANGSVTEFYPRFGFVEEDQFQYFLQSEKIMQDFGLTNSDVRKLDLSKEEDMAVLLHCHKKKNPFSVFQAVENESLLMFYCEKLMRDAVYYLEKEDAVMIAEIEGDEIECYDIYYDGTKNLQQLLKAFCGENLPQVTFLFAVEEAMGITVRKYVDEDTHLFVLSGKENIFHNARLFVPEISHT